MGVAALGLDHFLLSFGGGRGRLAACRRGWCVGFHCPWVVWRLVGMGPGFAGQVGAGFSWLMAVVIRCAQGACAGSRR